MALIEASACPEDTLFGLAATTSNVLTGAQGEHDGGVDGEDVRV
jgi:hypothetical protein